jgi:hypothetical protein
VALLDVNVLIALFDPDHVHHEVAHGWFEDHHASGWATCPLTQNGFLRTARALARSRRQVSLATLVEGLRTFTSSGHHQFWTDDLSLLDEERFDAERIYGHQQLTDIYLLALAVRHRGVLATFDRKIPIDVVKDARTEHVAVLAPVEA